MKLVKKTLALLLVLAMAISFVACGQGEQQSTSSPTAQPDTAAPADEGKDPGTDKKVDPLKIRLYNPVPGPVIDKVLADFSSIVSEKSGGAITCEITPAGTLGAEREATQLMLMGDLDMAVMSIDASTGLFPISACPGYACLACSIPGKRWTTCTTTAGCSSIIRKFPPKTALN